MAAFEGETITYMILYGAAGNRAARVEVFGLRKEDTAKLNGHGNTAPQST
jgi:hypothetical protein